MCATPLKLPAFLRKLICRLDNHHYEDYIQAQAQAARTALAGSYAELRSEGLRTWTTKTSKALEGS